MNAPSSSHYYVICGRVYDPDKKNFSARILEVKDGVFLSATPLVEFPQRELGVEIFDLLHYTLLPLLVDSRVYAHVDSWPLNPALRPTPGAGSFAMEAEGARQRLTEAQLAGIGLVRDMGDPLGISIAFRQNGTEVDGLPRMLTAGRGVCVGSECSCVAGLAGKDREGVARAVRRLVDDPRVDFIRLVMSCIMDWGKGTVSKDVGFGLEELRLAVEIAHDHGKAVAVECSNDKATGAAVQAGADFIEHGYLMSRRTMDLLGEKRLAWTPVFAPLHARMNHAECCGLSTGAVKSLESLLRQHANMLRYAHTHGVRILAGSDAGMPGVPHGGGLLRELEIMQEAGIPADDLLTMATSGAMDWFGQESRIAPGMPADYMAVRGSVRRKVADLSRVEWVARNGRVCSAQRPRMESDPEAESYGLTSVDEDPLAASAIG